MSGISDTRVVHDGRYLFQGETKLPVEQDSLQPLEIPLLVDAVSGRAAPDRYEQPDIVVVVQRADGNSGKFRDPANRVAYGFTSLRTRA